VELNREAAEEQAERYEGDPWEELILKWVEGRESVSIPEILTHCIEKKTEMWTQVDRNRVARCLRANGWKQYKARYGDRREWRYRRLG
jgi:predicted P-loop ATPase